MLGTLSTDAAVTELLGRQVKLRLLSPSKLESADVDQLWNCIQAELDASGWTYLPYPSFSSHT